MKKLKLAIIGTAGIPSNYGGFETLAEHLVNELGDALDIAVYCTKTKYKKEARQKSYKGARLIYLPFKANGGQSIIYDCVSIIHSLFYADVLLVLGVSAGFLIPFVRLFTGKKIITSIDGLEWKRNKWNKWARWFLWSSEWFAVKCSHANIADNESIQDYTAMRYKKLSNIIEYGSDHVSAIKPTETDLTKYPFLSRTYAIKVCRIEPENNIDMVLEAFSRLSKHCLVMIGNWNNSNYGVDLKKKYSSYQNIFLMDPIYDQHDINVLRANATVYIHGHSAGGTNPSLVEAMYLQLPVIAYGVKYNRTTTEGRALYFKSADELVDVIGKVRIKELKTVGQTMKLIADRRYKWNIIASKYLFLVNAVTEKSIKSSLQPQVSGKLTMDSMIEHGISHLQSSSLFYEKR